MRRNLWKLGTPVAVAAVLVVLHGLAGGQTAPATVDLTGMWRFDPASSETPWDSSGARGRGLGMGRGEGRGAGRPGVGEQRREGGAFRGRLRDGRGGPGGGARPGGRPFLLPALMHVTQTDDLVSFEDSTGVVVREISTATVDSAAHAPGAPVAAGRWSGAALEVERAGPRGAATEFYTLEAEGQRLVIRTRAAGRDSTKTREFKRVYRKVTE